jgi:nucleoside-diphosphate-sugar epimerase
MEKISVFGASGFIGSRFCEMYPSSIKMGREDREPATNNILNFISTTNNYAFEKDITIDAKSNIVVMLEILDASRKKFGDDFTFNQLSTWSVYGEVNLPVNERSWCNPTGFYSITKRTAEQLLEIFSIAYGCNYRIFRLCNIIGETAKNISKQKNALQYLIKELQEDKDITLYNNGNFLREFMYVDDACDAIMFLINYSNNGDIYNIGTGIPHNYGELIEYCKTVIGSKSRIHRSFNQFPHGSVQAKDIYLDVTKLNNLGFSPKYTVYDAINKIIKKDENDNI